MAAYVIAEIDVTDPARYEADKTTCPFLTGVARPTLCG
jgi:hypothetical protein